MAVPDFEYSGSPWTQQLGPFAADILIGALRDDGGFVVLDRRRVNEALLAAGVSSAYGAPLARAAVGYRQAGAALAVAGRIVRLNQISTAGGYDVSFTIDVQIIDVAAPAIITSERIDVPVEQTAGIAETAPWDAAAARRILGPAAERLVERLKEVTSRRPLGQLR